MILIYFWCFDGSIKKLGEQFLFFWYSLFRRELLSYKGLSNTPVKPADAGWALSPIYLFMYAVLPFIRYKECSSHATVSAAFARNNTTGELGSKAVAFGICHMNCVKWTRVSRSVGDHTSLSQVSTFSHHTQVTSVKLDETSNFASLPVSLNVVILFHEGVRVVDGVSIMGYQVRIPLVPTKIFLTLHNLHVASSGVIRWIVKRPCLSIPICWHKMLHIIFLYVTFYPLFILNVVFMPSFFVMMDNASDH